MLWTRPSFLLRFGACALLAAAAACSDSSKKSAIDADLAHDLALSNQTPAQPAFKDTALAPAPVAATPAPEPAPVERHTPRRERTVAPAPRQAPAPAPTPPTPQQQTVAAAPAPAPAATPAQIGSGTGIGLTSGGRVCTQANRPGDKIVATVNAPVVGQNGAVIPAGSAAVLEIASVTPGTSPETSTIQFRVLSVEVNGVSYSASGDATTSGGLERVSVSSGGMDKTKVIGGAIAGAIIGRIIGHGSTKGTVLGGAAGAAAGAAASRADVQYEGCLPSGSPLHLTLNEPLVLAAAR